MKKVLMLFLVVFFPYQVFAETGDTVSLAAGLTVEPYIIESKDAGFEADIVREIFVMEGYDKVEFVYQPLMRTKLSFKNGTVDGVMTIKKNYPEVQNAFISEEYISYHNVAVTLQSQNFKIDSVADLKDKRVESFQQARFALGEDFASMAENNPKYTEIADQRSQIGKLFAKRTDVIVLDRRIFKYYLNQLKAFPKKMMEKKLFEEPVTFHNIFESSNFRMAFKDEKKRDAFNSGLKKLRESGRYKQIIDTYVKE